MPRTLTPRRVALLIGAAGAAAAARKTSANGVVSSGSAIGRSLRLGRLGARSGAKYARVRAQQVFADVERSEQLAEAFQLETAESVAAELGNMKGAMMKVGQMASYLDQGMPEHLRDALAQLQQDAPPMSPELAAATVVAELGASPEVVFAEWDPVPIAAASIGQVHRAITHDGRAVAVKVQYPGVDAAIAADLSTADVLFAGLGMLFKGLDSGPVVEEIRQHITDELDYRLEAENQRLFAAFYEGHPHIFIPAVVDELSTQRVLTSELAEGVGWDTMAGWSQDERNLAAETIYRFVFRSLYQLRAFNGDPHPGNYLFQPGGRVTFLDFGLVKRFTPAELDVYGDMITAMVIDRDSARYRAILETAGLLLPDAPVSDADVEEYFAHFYAFVMERGPFTIDEEYATQTVRRIFDPASTESGITQMTNVPASFVIIQRINLGLLALLGSLEATQDWRSVAEEMWTFVDGPPSTPMGRQIAATWTARPPHDQESPHGR